MTVSAAASGPPHSSGVPIVDAPRGARKLEQFIEEKNRQLKESL
jgi:hypothetical protein